MTIDQFAERVKVGRARGQVSFGRDRFFTLAKRRQLGLVWILEDLSDQATAKFIIECHKYDVPVVHGGAAAVISQITGEDSVKVYLLKTGFPGLAVILRDLQAAGLLKEKGAEPGAHFR